MDVNLKVKQLQITFSACTGHFARFNLSFFVSKYVFQKNSSEAQHQAIFHNGHLPADIFVIYKRLFGRHSYLGHSNSFSLKGGRKQNPVLSFYNLQHIFSIAQCLIYKCLKIGKLLECLRFGSGKENKMKFRTVTSFLIPFHGDLCL